MRKENWIMGIEVTCDSPSIVATKNHIRNAAHYIFENLVNDHDELSKYRNIDFTKLTYWLFIVNSCRSKDMLGHFANTITVAVDKANNLKFQIHYDPRWDLFIMAVGDMSNKILASLTISHQDLMCNGYVPIMSNIVRDSKDELVAYCNKNEYIEVDLSNG